MGYPHLRSTSGDRGECYVSMEPQASPTGHAIREAGFPRADEHSLPCHLRAVCRRRASGRDVSWWHIADIRDCQLKVSYPLTKMSNVVLTSHLGRPTEEMYSQFADAAAAILLAYLAGKEVPRFVRGH